MKNRILLTLFLLLALCAQLSALGKKEEAEVKTQNDEWVLCVTDFDLKSMSEDKMGVAGVITRKVVERLNIISYRTRVSPEYAYYEGYAWAGKRTAAAKALSAKQDERSMLVYRGDPAWKYRQNIKKIDADIEKLRLALEEIENNAPPINREPVFKLTAGNMNASFPVAPKAGTESKFCADQKADAFLTGSIMDFHGRYYVSIKLYTLYTRSFVYEDSIIFSTDDIESALDEITGKLLMFLSGNKPAAIIVKAQPEETLVLINRSFAGNGETGVREYPPGKFIITASAPDHESMTVETELSGGELAEVDIRLKPVEYADVDIYGSPSGGSVYHGALYAGEAPLTLRLPLNTLEYIELETSDKKRGTAAFHTPENTDNMYSLSVRASKPQEKGSVAKARRWYYWAWGGTWITGIAAWIAYHSYVNADLSIRYDYAAREEYNQKFSEDSVRMYYISMGTMIAVGAAVAHEIFHMARYIYTANKGSTPIVKTGRQSNEVR